MQDTIKQIKELNEKVCTLEREGYGHHTSQWQLNRGELESASANAIMPLIDAYEESQKEKEFLETKDAIFGDRPASVRGQAAEIRYLTEANKALQSAVDELLGAVGKVAELRVSPGPSGTYWYEELLAEAKKIARKIFTKHKHLRSEAAPQGDTQ